MITDHTDPNRTLRVCGDLLRAELSAVEAYSRVIETLPPCPVLATLARLRDEHALSADALRQTVSNLEGSVDDGEGAWGRFSPSVCETAVLFGADSAIRALLTGESSGRDDYERALEDQGMMPGPRELIQTVLLPRIHNHLFELELLQSE